MVMHLTTSLDVGGAQAMLAKLVENAAGISRQPRHTVVSLMQPGAIAARLHAHDCPVYDLAMKRGWPTPSAILRLLRITRAIGPDLAQGWMYHGNVAASVAGAFGRVPVVWNIRHSLNDLGCESRATRMLLKISARLAHRTTAIIYNSQVAAAEHEAIGFPGDRAMIIPNGFDSTRFDPERSRRIKARALFGIPEGPVLICMLARLHPMKDHSMLVRAVARARGAGHDLHLLLVGPGVETPPPSLARAIADAMPSDRITLASERTDISDWLASVDVLALSSAWGEAFPNVLGEAMACGIPCVTTSVGDSAWILDKGGIVVSPRDEVAMGQALADLAEMGPDGRARIGAVGRARVIEHFAIESGGHQYRRLYEQLLTGPAQVASREAPVAALFQARPR